MTICFELAPRRSREITNPRDCEQLDRWFHPVYLTPRPIVEPVLQLQKKDR